MSDGNSTNGTCEFPDCGRPLVANGLCQTHRRQQRRGEPLHEVRKRRPDGSAPIIEYDEMPCPVPGLEGPCRITRLSLDGKGYGQVRCNGKNVRVHKHVWERDVGPVEDGKELDHLCMVKACCNVKHLRAVTHQVNATENLSAPSGWQINAAKTHCKNGHLFDEANTRISKRGRVCRKCERIRDERRYCLKVAARQAKA